MPFSDPLFDLAPTPLMALDGDLRYVGANRNYCETLATPVEALLGRTVFEVFPAPPEQERVVADALHAALAGEVVRIEAIPYIIDGRERWWTASHAPVRDARGTIVGVMQHTQDVTPQVEAERLQRVIGEEFDHRVRNIIAKISAMARATARETDSLPDFLSAFEPRVAAMGRAHDLLVRGGWEQLGLADLVASELAPWAGCKRISVAGENMPLSSRTAQALGLALHELATNAAKYGALSAPEGRLTIGWHRDADSGPLTLQWTERGITPVPSTRRGFGSTLIDRILPAETGGRVHRAITADGLDCRVVIPRP